MQGFERMRMFQQQCKLLQQRLCGGANPRIRDKYGVVMFDFSQTLVPMGIQTVGQVDLVLDRIEVMQQDLPAKIEKVDNDLRDASSIFKGMVELDDVDSDAKSNEHGAQNPQHIHTYIHTHIHTYIHTYTLHTPSCGRHAERSTAKAKPTYANSCGSPQYAKDENTVPIADACGPASRVSRNGKSPEKSSCARKTRSISTSRTRTKKPRKKKVQTRKLPSTEKLRDTLIETPLRADLLRKRASFSIMNTNAYLCLELVALVFSLSLPPPLPHLLFAF